MPKIEYLSKQKAMSIQILFHNWLVLRALALIYDTGMFKSTKVCLCNFSYQKESRRIILASY